MLFLRNSNNCCFISQLYVSFKTQGDLSYTSSADTEWSKLNATT